MASRRESLVAVALWLMAVVPAAAEQTRTALVPAADSSTQATPLAARQARLNVTDVPLVTALGLLYEKSRVPLSYSPALLPRRRVSCRCDTLTVAEALEHMLSDLPFSYREMDSQVVIVPLVPPNLDADLHRVEIPRLAAFLSGPEGSSATPAWVAAARRIERPQPPQGARVAGVVVDERTRAPLPNVPVAVVGTPLAGRTDASGRFTINNVTGSEATLRIQWIGYRPHTQVVRPGDVDVRIALTETAIELDAIVVTGTVGVQQARSIGNAVASVRAADITQLAPIMGIQDLVKGRVAGVDLVSGQGLVGVGGNTRIRGSSTLSLTNEPLIYIDGVRLDNNTNAGPNIRNGRQVTRMNDIDPDQIERIEIIKGPAAATLYGTEASSGVIQIITKRGTAGRPTIDVSVRQGANWFQNPEGRLNPVYGRDATGNLLELDLVAQENAAGRPIFSTGRLQGYDLGIRGGTDLLRYFIAGNYDHDVGVVDYNWLKRINTRANINLTPNDKLDISTSMGFVHSQTRFAQAATQWGVIDQITWGSPSRASTRTRGFLRATPEVAAEIESYSDLNRFTGSLQMKYTPLSWLSARGTIGGDVGEEKNSILFPRHPTGSLYFFGGQSLGEITAERRRVTYTTLDLSSTASFNLTADLNSATSVGAQHYAKQIEELSAVGRQFPSPGVTTVGGAASTTASGSFVQNKTLGLFIQEQLSWKNRIFLTAALRGDDNSAFGTNYNFVTYPKLSASWVLNEEPFWKWSAVSALKLRAAWGRAGQQPDVFASAQLYRPTTGPNDQSTITPSALGNPDLKPEVGEELELGFDAGLFRERLSVEFTFYDKSTKDAIVSRQVAPSAGFPGNQFVNLGEISTTGFELALRSQLLTGSKLALELTGTLSKNDNKIASLGGVPPGSGTTQNREGYPIRSYYFYKVLSTSLDANGLPVNPMCDDGTGAPAPCGASTPRVFMGHPDPTWEGSISSTLTLWEKLRVYALVDFKTGHTVNNGDIGFSHGSIGNSRAINERTDPFVMTYNSFNWLLGQGLMKGGFAKLREVSVVYTLPQHWVRLLRASRGTVSVAGRNIATLWVAQRDLYGTKMHDPEVYIGPTQTMLPQMASLVTTLRLTF